jgi:hypothetical protein
MRIPCGGNVPEIQPIKFDPPTVSAVDAIVWLACGEWITFQQLLDRYSQKGISEGNPLQGADFFKKEFASAQQDFLNAVRAKKITIRGIQRNGNGDVENIPLSFLESPSGIRKPLGFSRQG